MRMAACQFIDNLSVGHYPLHHSIINVWLNSLRECLASADPNIQQSAVKAIAALIAEYFPDEQHQHAAILDRFLLETTGTHQQARMGNALALGSMPVFILKPALADVVRHLCLCASITEKTVQWAEARKNALGALAQLTSTVGISPSNPGSMHS